MKINKIWEKLLETLKERIPESTYSTWVVNLVPNSLDGNEFSALCGQHMAIQLLSDYTKIFEETLSEIIGEPVVFKLIFSDELSSTLKKKQSKAKKDDNITDKYPSLTQRACNLNIKFKFENFIVGPNSQLAWAGATAVANKPGRTSYNPLFIYGNSGVGKTHLLQAIGNNTFDKGLKVKYCTSEELVNDVVEATAKGLHPSVTKLKEAQNKFHQKYRNCDILLIDDIQFIGGKERTQEEVFHIFESLYNSGKQIVLTSDRPPEVISKLENRLKTRFEGGLLVDIQPPELETRMAILKELSAEEKIPLSTDIIEFLATNYGTNVRELKGAFNNLRLNFSVDETVCSDLNSVKKALKFKENQKNYSPETIISEVAQYFNVSEKDILGTGRMKTIANARQVAIYLVRELTKNSFPSIGTIFDKKHSTIMYAYDTMQNLLKIDSHLKNAVDEIKKKLTKEA